MDRGRPGEKISLVDRPSRVMFGGPEPRELARKAPKPMEMKNPRKRPPPTDGPAANDQAQKRIFENNGPKGEEVGEVRKESSINRVEIASTSKEVKVENSIDTEKSLLKLKDLRSNQEQIQEKKTVQRGKLQLKSRAREVREITRNPENTCSTEESDDDADLGRTLEIELRGKADQNRKVSNTCKIYRTLKEWAKDIEAIRMSSRRKAEVIVKKDRITREILNRFGEEKNGDVRAFIPSRVKQRWGVISDWDGSLKELEEEIVPGQNVLNMEKMKRRRKIEGGFEWTETKAIKIIYRGASLPTKLVIMDGFVNLKVSPYVRNVRQCFGCLRFGHIKKVCRNNSKRCFNCGEDFHGQCVRQPKCVNCGGDHGALYRDCKFYQLEKKINTAMAYRNMSFEEARVWARVELRMGDREENGKNPTAWRDKRGRNWAASIPKWEDQPIPGSRNDWKERGERDREETQRRNVGFSRGGPNSPSPRTSPAVHIPLRNRYSSLDEESGDPREDRQYGKIRAEEKYDAKRTQRKEERVAPFHEKGQATTSRSEQRSSQAMYKEQKAKELQDNGWKKEKEEKDFQELLKLIREKGWEERIKENISVRIMGPPPGEYPTNLGNSNPLEEEDWTGDANRGEVITQWTKNDTKSGGVTVKTVRILPVLPDEDIQEEGKKMTTEEIREMIRAIQVPKPAAPVAGGSKDSCQEQEIEPTEAGGEAGVRAGPPDLIGPEETRRNEEPSSEDFQSPATDPEVTDYMGSDENE